MGILITVIGVCGVDGVIKDVAGVSLVMFGDDVDHGVPDGADNFGVYNNVAVYFVTGFSTGFDTSTCIIYIVIIICFLILIIVV